MPSQTLAADSIAEGSLTSPGLHVLLFDGVCPLCHGAVNFVLKVDRGKVVCFAPLQGPTAVRIAERHGFALDMTTAVYVRNLCQTDETVHFQSSAVLRAIGEAGPLWGLTTFILRMIPRPIRDFLYRFVASRRTRWFGTYEICPMPRPEDRSRFLP